MPTVLIYRDQLLPYSETFIPAQGESLSRYQAIYVGTGRLNQSLDCEKTLVLGEDSALRRFWKGGYKLIGMAPFHWTHVLSQHTPVLVPAHFVSDGGLVFPLCQQLKIPLMVTFHGYDATWDTPA